MWLQTLFQSLMPATLISGSISRLINIPESTVMHKLEKKKRENFYLFGFPAVWRMLQLLYTLSFEKYPLVLPSRLPTKARYWEGKGEQVQKSKNNEEWCLRTEAQISIGLCYIRGPHVSAHPSRCSFYLKGRLFVGCHWPQARCQIWTSTWRTIVSFWPATSIKLKHLKVSCRIRIVLI